MNDVFSQSGDFQRQAVMVKLFETTSTWHDDLRKAHLASHSCRSVHQVREVFPYLMDVSRKELQSHPQAWRCIQGKEGRDQDNVRRRQRESRPPQENSKKRILLVLSAVSDI